MAGSDALSPSIADLELRSGVQRLLMFHVFMSRESIFSMLTERSGFTGDRHAFDRAIGWLQGEYVIRESTRNVGGGPIRLFSLAPPKDCAASITMADDQVHPVH